MTKRDRETAIMEQLYTPVIPAKVFQLVAPREPKLGKSVDEHHQRL
jgi:hypothetical protein